MPISLSGSLNLSGSINTNGTITATTLVVQTITSSISSITGSTNFGSLVTDTHKFTGSLNVTGALYIATGSVGIGTVSPSQLLEVVGGEIKAGRVDSSNEGGQVSFGRSTDNATAWYIDAYGNTASPQLRFVNVSNAVVAMTLTGSNVGIGLTNPTDTDGYGGRVLDVNGPGYFRDNSDNTKYVSIGSVSSIGFIEANGTGNYLRFYTGGSGEKMRITTDGYTKMSSTATYVGAGGYYHECYGGTANGYTLIVASPVASPASQYVFDIRFTASTPNNTSARFLNCSDSTSTKAYIRSNGGLSNYQANNTDLSDIRTKKDIISLESYWNKFKALEIVKYKYKDQTHDDFNIGVIAQQVEEVAPEFVDVDGWDKNDIESESPLKSIYTKDLYHATIKVLQEAMAKIETLEARVQYLENK